MNSIRRFGLLGLLAAASLLAACASFTPAVAPEVRQALAPTGKLRVAVYAGSPTSMVPDPKTGQKVGVAYELGRELARQLDVPFEPVEFRLVAEVMDALKNGKADFTFTNASEERARVVDFTAPLIDLELGYLVPAGSAMQTLAEIDQPGRRIGVSRGSSSQGKLTRDFKHAAVVPVPSLKAAVDLLAQRQLDAFATNKGILFQLSDELPGARVLDGRWGLEHLAIAIPKGREAGMTFVRQFAEQAQASGLLQSIVERAGLRGTVKPVSP
jgi:polar amino acid transport system substrate-binding protein